MYLHPASPSQRSYRIEFLTWREEKTMLELRVEQAIPARPSVTVKYKPSLEFCHSVDRRIQKNSICEYENNDIVHWFYTSSECW